MASPFWLGCSSLSKATSYTKHTDLKANGELGQLLATHGDVALEDAAVPMPKATYAVIIVRSDAHDQRCNDVGLSPRSLRVTPLSGGKVGIPVPDPSCSAPPALPALDFVEASCEAGACVVTHEPSADEAHLNLTVTVASPGVAESIIGDGYVWVAFREPVQKPVSGNLTSHVGPAMLVHPITVEAE